MSPVNNINNNSTMRLVGISTGLDTDSIVQQLMNVEKQSLYKLQRQKQLAEWRQEAYREFTNALRSFKEKFFDITNRTSYFLSQNSFNVFKVASTAEEYVTAKGTSSSTAGSHTVEVKQLATAARAVGNEGISKAIISGEITDFNFSGKTIKVTLDGVTKEIKLEDYSNYIGDKTDNLANQLQGLLDSAFGSDKIKVSAVMNDAGNKVLQLKTANGATKLSLSSGSTNDGLSALGIAAGTSNRISTGSTLEQLADKLNNGLTFDASGNVSFEINGKSFTFSKNDTMQKVMNTINNDADAQVTLSYDEVKDRFILTAKQTGAGQNIEFDKGNAFFKAIGMADLNKIANGDTDGPGIYQGRDAIAKIDGNDVVRSSNTFTVNGVEYTLKKVHTAGSSATITVERDIDTVYNSIKSFVDEYNKLVDMFNSKLSEKYDRNYQPLTDDEKEAMTEDQIEKWENKAKTGLLRNDTILQQIQQNMRVALMDAVEGVELTLSSIGISSTSYQDKGKLTIDEDKLKTALRERPDQVRELLIKTSDTVPQYDRDLTSEQRKVRYKEQGLLHRISDILNDNISTIRNKNGLKGTLLEKAGIEGDLSQYNSSLSKEISSYDERISEMYTKLAEKEESYYNKFSTLEKYMSQMSSQLNYLLSSMGVYQ